MLNLINTNKLLNYCWTGLWKYYSLVNTYWSNDMTKFIHRWQPIHFIFVLGLWGGGWTKRNVNYYRAFPWEPFLLRMCRVLETTRPSFLTRRVLKNCLDIVLQPEKHNLALYLRVITMLGLLFGWKVNIAITPRYSC